MKRSLPLISLLFVSFFVCLYAAGAVCVLSVYAHTPQEKLQSVLMLGQPFALARWLANANSAGDVPNES